jgi:predicted nucleic acid-binding protein
MIYYLDTNAILDIMNNHQNIIEIFKKVYMTDIIRIPDIAYYEVMRGFKYKDPKKQVGKFIKFAEHCGIVYQSQESLDIASYNYASLLKQGNLIDDGDLLIGSLAIADNAIVVTNNTKHFSRLENIKLANWVE